MASPPLDVRLPLMVSADQAAEIDGWWHHNRLGSRAEAIRSLIALGLAADNSAVQMPHQTDARRPVSPMHSCIPNSEQPFPLTTIMQTAPLESAQSNTRISKRLDLQIEWIGRQIGNSKKDIVHIALAEFATATLRRWGIDLIT